MGAKTVAKTTGTSGAKYELRELDGKLTIWLVSKWGDQELRSISYRDDFESYADDEDEELRCLMADAFGETHL